MCSSIVGAIGRKKRWAGPTVNELAAGGKRTTLTNTPVLFESPVDDSEHSFGFDLCLCAHYSSRPHPLSHAIAFTPTSSTYYSQLRRAGSPHDRGRGPAFPAEIITIPVVITSTEPPGVAAATAPASGVKRALYYPFGG